MGRPLARVAAALLLCFLLGGLIEVHGRGAYHYENLGAHARFTPAASHPSAPRHVEAGREEERPACAACLHGRAARSLEVSLAAITYIATVGGFLPLPSDRHPSDPCAQWVGGRSPPLA